MNKEAHAPAPPPTTRSQVSWVIVIDDDLEILEALHNLIRSDGLECWYFSSAQAALTALETGNIALNVPLCMLCDVKMPGIDGLEFQQRLAKLCDIPLLLMSGDSGAYEAVSGFRAGAVDFLLKPIDADQLFAALHKALAASAKRLERTHRQQSLTERVGLLSTRELSVVRMAAKGITNVGIALEIGITERTVKFHRQKALEKLQISGTADLVRLIAEYDSLLSPNS